MRGPEWLTRLLHWEDFWYAWWRMMYSELVVARFDGGLDPIRFTMRLLVRLVLARPHHFCFGRIHA